MKRQNLIGAILSLILLASAQQSLFAGAGKPMLQVLDGSLNQLHKDSFNIVQDSLFFDPSYNSKLVKPYVTLNRVTFRINEASNVYLQSAFTATVRLHVATTLYGGSVTTVDTSLTINYRNDSIYTNRSTYAFRNAYKVQITVLSVTTNVGWNVWPALVVENEIRPFPVFLFSCTSDAVQSVSHAALAASTNADELPVSWGNVASAHVYDLEWMYADSSALAAGVYGAPGSPTASLLFDNNASRVTLAGTAYNIPLLYDGTGTLFFRVRSVQLLQDGSRAEAHWSSDFGGGMGNFFFNGHQRNLNWQATTSFSEEGKRKTVVQYYDGSLRARQIVTRDNTTDTIMVSETFYDYQGKPVIQVLPAPGLTSIIGYAQNFNIGLNGTAYNESNFDSLGDPSFYCSARADSMKSDSGAARYYSARNPSRNAGFNRYLPDAGGYPFIQVEYTPDNTGRISRQGGVGNIYQLGGGHETFFSYGTPDQRELDALFGTEAGDKSHYYKTMTRDGNGQYSLHYTDMHGRTIATALAGTPPDSIRLDKLASNMPALITEVLADSGSAVIKDLVMESKKGLLVPFAATDTFTYILNPASLQKADCNNASVCYDCLYDLEITITDDCNNQKLGGQPFDTVIHNFSLATIDTTCSHTAGAFSFTFTKFLQEGSYEVTKRLSVSRAGMDFYRDSVFRKRNTCKTVTSMINVQRAFQASITLCQPTCQSCKDSLGTWPSFQQRFMLKSGIAPADSAQYRGVANQAYLQAQEDCNALCGKISEFDDTRNAMLLDLTPPSGQYANPDSSQDLYSIFYTKYTGSTVTTPPDFTLATGYVNGDGLPDSVYDEATGSMVLPQDLSSSAFTQKFKLSWAEALLPYHPEYCKYARYQQLANSSLWDTRFGATDTYLEALQKGYLNPTGNGATPFNKYNGTVGQIDADPIDTCSFFNFKPGLEAQLKIYTATGSNAASNHPVSMWAMASAMVTCGQIGNACFTSKANDDSAFNSHMCPGDLDAAWRNFRQLYQDAKRKLINDQLKSACTVPSAGTLVTAHHTPHFSDGAELLAANGVTLPTTAGDTTTAKNQAAANASGYYLDNCTAYATQWWKQLAGCAYTSTDSAIIVPQLIQVCRAGSDVNHPVGASSVAPSSTYKYRSFREVLQHFSDSTRKGYNNNNACNPYLITDPPPYDKPRPYSDLVVRSKPDDCQCTRITKLYAAYQLNNQGYGSFSAYVNGLNNTTMTETDLQALRSMCAVSNASCTFAQTPITIPAALQCGGEQSCITCTQMAATYARFVEDFPSAWRLTGTDSASFQAYYDLFTNYFNARLGYKKLYADYQNFITQCGIPYLQPVLGANLLPGPIVVQAATGTAPASGVRCDTLQSLITQFNAIFPSLARFNHGTVRKKQTFYPSVEYLLTCSAPGSKIVNPAKWVGSGLRTSASNWFRDTLTFVKFDFSNFAGKSTLDSVIMKMSPVLTKPFDTLVYWCNMATVWDTTLSCGQLGASFTSNTLTTKPPFYQYTTPLGHVMYAYLQTTQMSPFIKFTNNNTGEVLTSFLNTTLQAQNSVTFLGSSDSIVHADPDARPHLDVYYRMDTIFQCKDLVAAWFNGRLNTSMSYDSLVSLYHVKCGGTFSIGCTNFSDTLKLCGRSEAVFPAVTLPQVTSCSDSTFFSVSKGTELYNVYSDSLNNNFDSAYRALCMQAYKFESFTVRHATSTYHYNLYYYDQAGNLLKTVPPEGVHPVTRTTWLDSVQTARNIPGRTLTPGHTLVTQYRYNTIDQVVAQRSPDGGQSRLWYDKLGRLALNQDARQRTASGTENGRLYTYTLHDVLGRITEVGQIANATTTAMTDSISRNPAFFNTWLNNSVAGRSQITQTIYDLTYTGFTGTPIVQRNLRNRLSYASFTVGNNPAQFNQASFYTYDILGNVDTLLQDYGSSSLPASQNVMNSNGNRWKKAVYQFDLISGKMNFVAYQAGQADQLYHRYSYDADNRLVLSETSSDSIIWEKDERYEYYKHGPLARRTIGEQLVQGMDYAYTLQSWLKGINSTALNASFDMGGDGKAGGVNQYVAKDAVSISLNYFNGDYAAINSSLVPFPGYSAFLNTAYRPLFNGNISSSVVNIGQLTTPVFYNYTYDQLNRLTAMDAYSGLNQTTNTWSTLTLMQDYKERMTYDANGNILKYLRNGFGSNVTMDSLSYNYNRDAQGNLNNNQLNYIRDRVNNSTSHSGNYTVDIEDQALNNYLYDSIGNLRADVAEGITSITWTPYGKIAEIQRTATGANPVTDIIYTYDAMGNRISKRVQLNSGAVTITCYVRDAQGNVLATYIAAGTGTTYSSYSLTLTEQHLYGMGRVGVLNRAVNMRTAFTPGSITTTLRGIKNYELDNHLGNVLATITDRKTGVSSNGTTVDYYTANISSATDYYPFGMQQPGRNYNVTNYRYGFNGKENDNDVKGSGNQIDYGERIYDTRVGRFLSTDPLTRHYPWYTPYQYAGNSPILNIDVDGMEPADAARFAKAVKMVQTFQNDKSIQTGVFKHISKAQLTGYLLSRLKDQTNIRSPYNSCGPTSAVYVAITHDPEQFVKVFTDLWQTGKANDGDIKAPDDLKDYKYPNRSWIDVALIGSVRASENVFGGYDPVNKNKQSKYKNATTPQEYPDLVARLGVSVDISSTGSAKYADLVKWTASGKRLVLFGNYTGLQGVGNNPDDDNVFGGDHFVTVHSINENQKTKKVTVRYWDHGENKQRSLRNWTFKNKEEFMKAFAKAYYLTNTGNKNK
jgi:RHS repeat-associated protein